MPSHPFELFVLSPLGVAGLEFARAASSAGVTGILDLSWLDPVHQADVLDRLSSLEFPLHLSIDLSHQLIHSIVHIPAVKGVFVGASPTLPERRTHILEAVSALRTAGRKVYLEVLTSGDLELARSLPLDGVVLKGAEGAGWCSAETSLVLLQRASGLADLSGRKIPLIVQGGVGPLAVPGLALAGASGAVLEACTWLLAESPLSEGARTLLANLDDTDTGMVGRRLSSACRVLARVASRNVRALWQEEEQRDGGELEAWEAHLRAHLREQATGALQSERPIERIIPIGQDAALAAGVSRDFQDIAGLVAGIDRLLEQACRHVEAQRHLLSDQNPILAWHGMPYPFVMGPMAQVSECPPFLQAVGRTGALPFISLGNTRRERARALLTDIRTRCEGLAWGAGIIGLPTNQEAWEAHLELFDELRPPFVTVAAGSIEQARRVRAGGHRVYLHTPSRGTIRMALEEAGPDRPMGLILEGAECGGHIGTLSSLALWQAGVEEISRHLAAGHSAEGVSLLLAGGIADPAAVAFAAGSTADLVARGVKVGLQLGSAYLMTGEALETQAVTPEYQTLIARSRGTAVLGETLGLRVRCLPNPAAEEIVRLEYERARAGEPLYDRKHLFENDNLGGLKLAAKGVVAEQASSAAEEAVDVGGGRRYRPASHQERIDDGLYHVGQVAALLEHSRPAAELHTALSEGGRALLEASLMRLKTAGIDPRAVAIIGLGSVLPGGRDVDAFWEFLKEGRDCIREVPAQRWRKEDHFSDDHAVPDRTYSAIGAFVEGFTFDALKFRILPRVTHALDETQKWSLHATAEALVDAGYGPGGKVLPHESCAVILANPTGGEQHYATTHRVLLAGVPRVLESLPEAAGLHAGERRSLGEALLRTLKSELPEINEDSMPGELSNVTAGRIASAFNLRGPSYTVDAACASSLAAVADAVTGLQRGDFDLAITGGVDRTMGPNTYVKFSKIGALSSTGSRPFDAGADGFVMGEGCVIMVLKRLADAVRDGDRIYALIRGVGSSSDGKGRGITAPNPVGQKLALARAYQSADIDPKQVSLIEAHGTSTPVGDATEVGALAEFFQGAAAGSISLGSVKSQIGHLKGAAGAASLLKATLALYHRTLPPSANFRAPSTTIAWESTPFRVPQQAAPWPRPPHGRYIAGVSAFGFGGTNYHLVLEAFEGSSGTARSVSGQDTRSAVRSEAQTALPTVSRAPVQAPLQPDMHAAQSPAPRQETLLTGILTIGAADREALRRELAALKDALARGEVRLEALAEPSRLAGHPVRLTVTWNEASEVPRRLEQVLAALGDARPEVWSMLANQGVTLGEGQPGPVAFMYPGQGSQSINMIRALRERFPIVGATFEEADEAMRPILKGRLTDLIFIPPDADPAKLEAANAQLAHTTITQPAILAADIAMHRLLEQQGITPTAVLGHSLGEYAALVAAGSMTFPAALKAVSARGHAMADLAIGDPGRMASVAASWEQVAELLRDVTGYVEPANKNSRRQTVIAGETDAVNQAIAKLRARSIHVTELNVSHAFHSRIVAPASEPLRKVLEGLGIRTPRLSVISNVTAELYPSAPADIVALLARQVAAPVEFVACIERLYELGYRTFVECGPRAVLTRFVQEVLAGRNDVSIIATNVPKRGDVASLRDAIAALWARGVGLPEAPRREAIGLAHRGLAEVAYDESARTALSAGNEVVHSAVIETALSAGNETAPGVRYEMAHTARFGTADAPNGQSAPTGETGQEPTLIQVDEELPVSDSQNRSGAGGGFVDFLNWQRDTFERFLDRTFQEYQQVQGIQPATRARIEAPTVQTARTASAIAQPGPGPLGPVARAGGNGLETTRAEATPVRTVSQAEVPAREMPARAPSVRELPVQEAPAREVSVVVSGVSIGFPGRERRVFDEANLERLFQGQSFLDPVPEPLRRRMLELNIVRLVKERDQDPHFERLAKDSEVIHLAGQRGALDLVKDYGLSSEAVATLDVTSMLAVAAAIEALHDAGIPLVRRYRETSKGGKLPDRWVLPPTLADDTGVIFASAFPGYNQMLEQQQRHLGQGADGSKQDFDRKFLFEVLSFGHAQVAEMLGIRGPNTQVNAACASTTQAVAIAEDWIRAGRCRRVLVLGADDVTSEAMMPWIGAGFLASGAATTESRIEDAALPFDRRRHGMLIGMGAVGMVIEAADAVAERGVAPLAELLATVVANSAYHGSRLDGAHLSAVMERLVTIAERRGGVLRQQMAADLLFMSHETFTPARGGSASAEVAALRQVFGARAADIPIANTKGFTGHPMAAGLEDGVVLKCLQYGRVPPIANLRDPDPDLMPLNLSAEPRRLPVRFGLRLAAGFGSQVAMTLFRKVADGDVRVAQPEMNSAWLKKISGQERPVVEIVLRTLRVAEAQAPVALSSQVTASSSQETPVAPPATALTASASGAQQFTTKEILDYILDTVSQKTGYPIDLLDPALDLEADLGIDTIKQAEVFASLRDHFFIPKQDNLKLRDYPTLQHLVQFVEGQLLARVAASSAPVVSPVPATSRSETIGNAPAGGEAPEGARDVPEAVNSMPEATPGGATSDVDAGGKLQRSSGDKDTAKTGAYAEDVREVALASTPRRRAVVPVWRAPLIDYPPTGIQLEGARVLLMGADSVTAPLEELLKARGAVVLRAGKVPGEESARAAWLVSLGEVSGVFWLGGPSTDERHSFPDSGAWQALIEEGIEAPWLLARGLAEALDRSGGFFVAATRLGGAPGKLFHPAQQPVTPMDGALVGMCKALAREWSRCLVKAVDFPVICSPESVAETLLSELLHDAGVVEVGHRAGNRWVAGCAERPFELEEKQIPAQEDMVYLCVGGAQGITAELVEGVARWSRGRFVLTGRTSLSPAPDPRLVEPVDLKVLRRSIADALRAAGGRATPKEIETELGRLQREAAIHAMLARLHALGCQAEYQPVDVTDAVAVQQLVEGVVERFGQLDVVLHAAGVESSRLIADKTLDELRRVVSPKVIGWANLVRSTEHLELSAFVTFSSVAARFGNRGQTDYAAANDLLNHGARWLAARRPGLKALSIDWTAWTEIGMASRGSILEQLLQAGVVPMTPEQGRDWLAQELRHASLATEVVVDCGLGLLEAPARDQSGSVAASTVEQTRSRFQRWLAEHPGTLPLLGEVSGTGEEGVFEVRRTLNPLTDRFLRDHALDGVPILPGVIGLELFAESARLALGPELRLHGFKDVRFLRALKIHPGRVVTAHVRLRPLPRSRPDQVAARCQLVSFRPGPAGGAADGNGSKRNRDDYRLRVHFEAIVVLGPSAPQAFVERLPDPGLSGPGASPSAIYGALFHGPAFQVCGEASATGEDGSWASASSERVPILPNELEAALSAHPMEVELALQTAGLWELSTGRRMGLPAEIQRISILKEEDRGWKNGADAVARAVSRQDGSTTFQVEVRSPDGEPLLKIEGYETVGIDSAAPDAGLWELRKALKKQKSRGGADALSTPASNGKEDT